jgi:hypothetical protein
MKNKYKIIYLNNFIYILTNDKIEDNDWFINILQNNKIYQNNIKNYNVNKSYLKKIIATTDISLKEIYKNNLHKINSHV